MVGYTNEEFFKFAKQADMSGDLMQQYKEYTGASIPVTQKLASSLKSIVLNLGANLLITAAIYGAIKAFDHFNVTVEEQQEKVDGLNEKISTLKTEYDELSGKGELTDQEKTRLEMLQ